MAVVHTSGGSSRAALLVAWGPVLLSYASAHDFNDLPSDILLLLASCGAENSVYMKLEHWIAAKWGVEPRGWYEPDYSWQEQQRPGTTA